MGPLALGALRAAWEQYDRAEDAAWRLYRSAPSTFSGRLYVASERRARQAMIRAVSKIQRMDREAA